MPFRGRCNPRWGGVGMPSLRTVRIFHDPWRGGHDHCMTSASGLHQTSLTAKKCFSSPSNGEQPGFPLLGGPFYWPSNPKNLRFCGDCRVWGTKSVFLDSATWHLYVTTTLWNFSKGGAVRKSVAFHQIPPNYMENSTKIPQSFGELNGNYINYRI